MANTATAILVNNEGVLSENIGDIGEEMKEMVTSAS